MLCYVVVVVVVIGGVVDGMICDTCCSKGMFDLITSYHITISTSVISLFVCLW